MSLAVFLMKITFHTVDDLNHLSFETVFNYPFRIQSFYSHLNNILLNIGHLISKEKNVFIPNSNNTT
jgi:hypothetical protein